MGGGWTILARVECHYKFLYYKSEKHFAMRLFPYSLPSPPAHLGPTCKVIETWLQDVKDASEQQIKALILAFLDEDYMLLVPLPIGAFFANAPSGCHHWF